MTVASHFTIEITAQFWKAGRLFLFVCECEYALQKGDNKATEQQKLLQR